MLWLRNNKLFSVTHSYLEAWFNPLYRCGFLILFLYIKLGTVHNIYLEMSGYNTKILNFLFEDNFCINAVDSGEMPHHVAFHLGLHCWYKYQFRGFSIYKVLNKTRNVYETQCPQPIACQEGVILKFKASTYITHHPLSAELIWTKIKKNTSPSNHWSSYKVWSCYLNNVERYMYLY